MKSNFGRFYGDDTVMNGVHEVIWNGQLQSINRPVQEKAKMLEYLELLDKLK
jgi:hypothetical protein